MYDLIAEISTLIFSKFLFLFFQKKQQRYSQNGNLTEKKICILFLLWPLLKLKLKQKLHLTPSYEPKVSVSAGSSNQTFLLFPHRCPGFYCEPVQWPPLLPGRKNKQLWTLSDCGTCSESLWLRAGLACRARLLMCPCDYRPPNPKILPLSASHLEPQVVTWLASTSHPHSC